MKKSELRQLIKEEISKIINENDPPVKIIPTYDFYIIEFPSGFKDEFFKTKDPNILFTDTIAGNNHYNKLINNLKQNNIPYKERKARTDNSVRIEIPKNISPFFKENLKEQQ
jgi:hypothetical protein